MKPVLLPNYELWALWNAIWLHSLRFSVISGLVKTPTGWTAPKSAISMKSPKKQHLSHKWQHIRRSLKKKSAQKLLCWKFAQEQRFEVTIRSTTIITTVTQRTAHVRTRTKFNNKKRPLQEILISKNSLFVMNNATQTNYKPQCRQLKVDSCSILTSRCI